MSGRFMEASVTPSSQNVGDFNNDITVRVRLQNPVPVDGLIKIAFPYWNPGAKGTIYNQYSYLVNQGSVQCLSISDAPLKQGSIPCTFDKPSQTLTLKSGVFTASVG